MKFGSQFTFVLAAGKNLKTVARVRGDNFLLRPGKFQREDATDLAIYNFDERKFRGEGPGETGPWILKAIFHISLSCNKDRVSWKELCIELRGRGMDDSIFSSLIELLV